MEGQLERQLANQMAIHRKRDKYCWICHAIGDHEFECSACFRICHVKRLSASFVAHIDENGPNLCPQCTEISGAERDARHCDRQALSTLLWYAFRSIRRVDKRDELKCMPPVSRCVLTDDTHLISRRMDWQRIDRKLQRLKYASICRFVADIKLIHHNCVILFEENSKFVKLSQMVVNMAEEECNEMMRCADCYRHIYELDKTRSFIEPCRTPHAIVWAKLDGYSYWPSKAIAFDSSNNQVLVKFFETHDSAWIKQNRCYLISAMPPIADTLSPKNKIHKQYVKAMEELKAHVRRLDETNIAFKYWPQKTPFEQKYLYLINENIIDRRFAHDLQEMPINDLKIVLTDCSAELQLTDRIEGNEAKSKKVKAIDWKSSSESMTAKDTQSNLFNSDYNYEKQFELVLNSLATDIVTLFS